MPNTPAILEKRLYTAAAHQVCPYSNATRGNIVVDVKLAEH
jgi:organic hydroperoxide reductase OsmC/OhrA